MTGPTYAAEPIRRMPRSGLITSSEPTRAAGLITALWCYEDDPRGDSDKHFAQFQYERAKLSRAHWNRLAERVCKPGVVSNRGIEIRELKSSDAEHFESILGAGPPTAIRRDEYIPGHYPMLPPWLIWHLNKVSDDSRSDRHRKLIFRGDEIPV